MRSSALKYFLLEYELEVVPQTVFHAPGITRAGRQVVDGGRGLVAVRHPDIVVRVLVPSACSGPRWYHIAKRRSR